jgi:hypothetical protein
MWVSKHSRLYNLNHAVDLWLVEKCIYLGFVDGSKAHLEFASKDEAQRFFKVLVLRLGRLDGVLVAEGVKDARQD